MQNAEFRLGEIEHLPVGDNSTDVVISNCVINLSPDKPQVLREVFRVLRPGMFNLAHREWFDNRLTQVGECASRT